MKKQEATQWIPALTALTRAATASGGEDEGVDALLDLLKRGWIRAKAARFAEANGTHKKDALIPVEYWMERKASPSFPGAYGDNWALGDFQFDMPLRHYPYGKTTMHAYKVSFSADDIDEHFPGSVETSDVLPTDKPQADTIFPDLVSDRTGGPGPRSSMHIIQEMMKRRIARAENEPKMRAEAAALAKLFEEHAPYSGLKPSTPKTIYNRLGALYRQLTNIPE